MGSLYLLDKLAVHFRKLPYYNSSFWRFPTTLLDHGPETTRANERKKKSQDHSREVGNKLGRLEIVQWAVDSGVASPRVFLGALLARSHVTHASLVPDVADLGAGATLTILEAKEERGLEGRTLKQMKDVNRGKQRMCIEANEGRKFRQKEDFN